MINQTKDYSIFKQHPLNRAVNQRHVENIKKSMLNRLTPTYIKVDKEFRIVDGQHRFEALRQLGYPIKYIQDDFTTEDMKNENTNKKNWGLPEFVDHYAKSGVESYQKLLFLSKFHNLSLGVIINIYKDYSNHDSVRANSVNKSNNNINSKILNGYFDFDSNELDIKITRIKKVTNNFKLKTIPRNLIYAIIRLLKRKDYNHERMIHKSETFPQLYRKCIKIDDYVEMLEDIYNYRSQDKVSFKY